MHEMSIAQSILDAVLEQGEAHRLQRVKTIKLQIGAMAAVVPSSLTFCFDLLTKNTIASDAVLEIETAPVVARCPDCNLLFEVEDLIFLCPQCEKPAFEVVSGRDLLLMSIEGETGDEDGGDKDTPSSEHPSGE